MNKKFKPNKNPNWRTKEPKQPHNKQYIINDNNKKKTDNVFLLTRDNFYHIIERKYLYKTTLFKTMFEKDRYIGNLKRPIFLQKVKNHHFKLILEYLKYHFYNQDDGFESPDEDGIIIQSIYSYYENSWDRNFIKKIVNLYKNNIEEINNLLETIKYIGMENMYNKIKYCKRYLISLKNYKLDDI